MIEKDITNKKWEKLSETLSSFPAVSSFELLSEETYDRIKNEYGYVFCAVLLPNKKWMTYCARWTFRQYKNGIWHTMGHRTTTNLLEMAKEGWLVLIAKINLPEIPDEL